MGKQSSLLVAILLLTIVGSVGMTYKETIVDNDFDTYDTSLESYELKEEKETGFTQEYIGRDDEGSENVESFETDSIIESEF